MTAIGERRAQLGADCPQGSELSTGEDDPVVVDCRRTHDRCMDTSMPLLRSRLLGDGYRDDELRRLRLKGELVAVRPGCYVPSADSRLRRPEGVHEFLLQGTVPLLGAGSVLSHASAGFAHGLPLWAVPLDRVHVTKSRRAGGRRGARLHVHVSALEPDEMVAGDETVVAAGIAVTSLTRTVVDLARTLPFEVAVPIADAALRSGKTTVDELVANLERHPGRKGGPAAARVIAFADGGSESVGESRSRVAMHRHGLPGPVLQWEVISRNGVALGRTDFGWPETGTVGEFDGRIKYNRLARPGELAGDVVFREKRREDRLRDQGLRVVRWVWDDLTRFEQVAQRLRSSFARGSRYDVG